MFRITNVESYPEGVRTTTLRTNTPGTIILKATSVGDNYPKDNYSLDNYLKDNYPRDNYPKDNYLLDKNPKGNFPRDN